MYSRTGCVFTLEHFFASKSFTAFREAFSNACPDKEAPNKIPIQRLATKCRVGGYLVEGGEDFHSCTNCEAVL
jgi:hypothetical protein